jgi:type I restriction enzyme S subunit
METSWSLEPIFNYVSLAQGFAVNSKSRHVIKEKGELPLLRITDLINSTKSQFIDADSIAAKFVASPDELIYTRTGQVGLVFRNKHGVVHNNCFKVIPNESLDKDYLYWFLKQRRVIEYVNSIASGSVQKDLNHKSFLTLELPIPDVKEQRAIAQILDALENKIELNRQMNETLEAMAQALFKSWFVDFDPVIDNALAAGNEIPEPLQARAAARQALGDQRKPLPPEIQAQFPSSFVLTDEMGCMPEGWKSVTFEKLVEAKQGKYLAKGEMIERPNDDFSVPVWGGNGILGYGQQSSYEEPVTLMTCRGSNCGLIKTTKSSAWVSNNSFACRPKIGSDYFLYIYFLMDDFSDCISGSAQPQITYTALKNKKMKYPVSNKVCEYFSSLIEDYRKKQFQNDLENESLSNLRDTLLPKLLSGELCIADAEKQVAETL